MTSKRGNTASAKGRDIAPGVPAQKGKPVVSNGLVNIEGDEIVIRVPIDALPEACAIAWESSLGEHGIAITDLPVFAKEFVRELRREEENGDTLVHKMLDRAAYMAANNGAEGLSE